MTKKNSFILLVIIFLAPALTVFVISQHNSQEMQDEVVADLPAGETHIVNLGDQGYEPRRITIKKGDVIVFTTTRGKHHWPASNLHPTHTIYSEFDPEEPIAPDESWSFQFNRVGEWGLHDHLGAHFTGVITVTE